MSELRERLVVVLVAAVVIGPVFAGLDALGVPLGDDRVGSFVALGFTIVGTAVYMLVLARRHRAGPRRRPRRDGG
ncbi:hypothetical protein [Jiangella anatolica]|uniref:Uncharacterized protein n=1 Tax=Jiangella anatolica TaxID=2670374 RepID=A0A2W2C5U4_9ACTN|nr:hypothetical protein [Jiangella anatolica]PZF83447.1 hypothetical protein C1I92_12665 [Jiangella anatolica]